MRSKDFVTALVILAILLLALGALNYYVVQPALTPKFTAISSPQVRAPVQSQRSKRAFGNAGSQVQKIVQTTMDKIKGMFPKKDFTEKFEPRQVTRNPFFWPYEAITPDEMRAQYEKSLKDTEQAAELGTRLKMVILGENKKIALINNQILFEGSTYGTDTVQNIYEREVVLAGPSGETHLMLARAVPSQTAVPEKQSETETAGQTINPAHEESVDSLFNKLKPFLGKEEKKELERVNNSQKK